MRRYPTFTSAFKGKGGYSRRGVADGLCAPIFFDLEAEGEEMPLGGEERAASVGLRRAAGGDCNVLKFWR